MTRPDGGDVVESAPTVDEIGADDLDDVLRRTGTLLIEFGAEWCGPCHAMRPILDELASEHRSLVRVARVDVATFPAAGERFDVQSVPTFVLFVDGTPVVRLVGARTKRQLDRTLRDVADRRAEGARPAGPARTSHPQVPDVSMMSEE